MTRKLGAPGPKPPIASSTTLKTSTERGVDS
jgi:hypothetical protein